MQHPLYLGCCQKVRQSLRGGGRQACTFCRSRSRINPHFLGNRALQTVMFLLGQFSQVCLLATERLHRVGRGIPSVSASSQLGARAVFVSISVLRIPKCFLLLFGNMKHYGQWWLPPVCSQRRVPVALFPSHLLTCTALPSACVGTWRCPSSACLMSSAWAVELGVFLSCGG